MSGRAASRLLPLLGMRHHRRRPRRPGDHQDHRRRRRPGRRHPFSEVRATPCRRCRSCVRSGCSWYARTTI